MAGSHIAALLAREVAGGAALGIGGGYLLLALINRLEAMSGLYPILALAGATALFGGAQTVGASGFLAVYLAGLILGSHRHRATQVINQAFDAFAWLSQIVLFLMLGLLVTPRALVPTLGTSLVVAAVLMLVARPLAVALCLLPFRYTAPEIAFISWFGLRGAVPIFLAIIPVLAGLADAAIFFGVAFITVLTSLVASELVLRRGMPPAASYIFKHALVQEAAHETLLRTERRRLHARIADLLEQRAEVVERQPELLAQHYAEAGINDKRVSVMAVSARNSSCENSRPMTAPIWAISLAEPSRSRRAARDA